MAGQAGTSDAPDAAAVQALWNHVLTLNARAADHTAHERTNIRQNMCSNPSGPAVPAAIREQEGYSMAE